MNFPFFPLPGEVKEDKDRQGVMGECKDPNSDRSPENQM